jgi:predicted RecA/RadA family phage recombinase
MTNYVQPGDSITIADAGATVVSGQGLQYGQLFGVAAFDSTDNNPVVIKTTGVFTLPKTSAQAWTVGALIYWTGTECTTTSTSNLLIGCAVVAADNPSATGTVRLNGTAVADS